MRIAYFDCFSGISGDMALGAFIDAGLSFKALSSELAKLKIKNYRLTRSKVFRGGICGTGFRCVAGKTAHSRPLGEILSIIKSSSLCSRVKNTAIRIFESIGAAEAKVHGVKDGNDIRLHELGSVDSIVDIVGASIALNEFGIDGVYASPVTTGRGSVMTAHGRLPVPAPAALELLRDIPVNMTGAGHELVTPTGAAIIKALAKSFGDPPGIKVDLIGYGAGSRDEAGGLPNMLRLVVGESTGTFVKDSVCVIETNIDDMNPQVFGHLFERLFKKGALDVYVTNVHMKKSRPGFKLTVLAEHKDRDIIASVIFSETTTIGLRYHEAGRLKLMREKVNVSILGGDVGVKISKGPGGILTTYPEYDECARIARRSGVPLKTVIDEARTAAGRI